MKNVKIICKEAVNDIFNLNIYLMFIYFLVTNLDVDLVSPNSDDDDFFIRNENAFWITNDLFRNIGRSRVCVVREHYLDLFSITRTRDTKDVFSTPLHIAAAKIKDFNILKSLLSNEKIKLEDINARNRYGETALLLALKENVDNNIIILLLEHCCDCTIGCFRGITPLHVASLDNKVDIMLKLIERGADVNSVSNIGITPIHLGVLASHYEATNELLNCNANPKLVTTLEFTPLMLALAFQDIDLRICELLYTYDIHTSTRIGNPLYCAIKGRHIFTEKLIFDGADVNFVGHIHGVKISCLLEVISQNNKHYFDLIWSRFNQSVFEKKLNDFLSYFVNSCAMKGSDLVECLCTILSCTYGGLLIENYYKKRNRSFLEIFFENLEDYQLTSDDCCKIINSLPVVFYEDILYIYKKFNFDRELVSLLKSYEYNSAPPKSLNIFIDYLCYNTVKKDVYNLKEILHFLKYHTPDNWFRIHFHATFAGIASSTDSKLQKLIYLYNLCEKLLVKHSVASLQELARDKLRKIFFLSNKKPYKAISELPIPETYKDVLLLKMPIYC